jgi:hypothetical protein
MVEQFGMIVFPHNSSCTTLPRALSNTATDDMFGAS